MRVYYTYSKNSQHKSKSLVYEYKDMDAVKVLLTVGLAEKPVLK
jgi:hypothetical protein